MEDLFCFLQKFFEEVFQLRLVFLLTPRTEHFLVVAKTTTNKKIFKTFLIPYSLNLNKKHFLTFEIKVATTKMKQGHADQNNKTFHPYLGMMYIAERTSKHVPIDQKI